MHPSGRVLANAMILLMLMSVGGTPNSASAQDQQTFAPYPVYVAQEGGYARCGPSPDYYRTDPLRHGQELEVYAETDDGWLGIRPPEDSFCWVPADAIEIDPSGSLGTVTEDRTVAWIGTHLGRARKYRWQVQLAEGEPVTVVGKSEREGPDGPQLWYRIVPPSGEFRWVHHDQIVASSEELVASLRGPSRRNDGGNVKSSTNTATDLTTKKMDSSRQADAFGDPEDVNETRSSVDLPVQMQATFNEPLPPSITTPSITTPSITTPSIAEPVKPKGLLASVAFLGRPRLRQIGTADAPSPLETAGADNWVTGIGRQTAVNPQAVATVDEQQLPITTADHYAETASPALITQASGIEPLPVQALTPIPAPTPALKPLNFVSVERIAQIEAETRNADIEQLSLVLSRLMASQSSAAEAEPVARSARILASTTTDSVVAERARLLAERADQYSRVATRRDGEAVIRSSGVPSVPAAVVYSEPSATTTPAVSISTEAAGVPAEPAQAPTMYSGYLVQVYSARPHSPPFALTDNTGRTIAYVTPSPGVNLRTHLNSKVSVSGTGGFLTGLNTPHLLAIQAVRTAE